MRIVEVNLKDQQKYNEFVGFHPLGSIHQTWEWGVFQSKSNSRGQFWVFAMEDNNGQILASALIILQKLPLGKCWLYCPRGPLIDYQNKEICTLFFDKIAALAREQNAVFLRFDPPLQIADSAQAITFQKTFATIKAHRAHAKYQPENTLILDLTLPEEQLLAQMKHKGRYNIKIAQRYAVRIKKSDNPGHDVNIFYDLLQTTAMRDQFSAHPLSYYQAMFEVLSSRPGDFMRFKLQDNIPSAKLYIALYQQKPIAAIIVTYFKDTATYYFGASGNEYRNVMAPYLLQWQAILDAKKAGCRYYDFLGIAPPDEPNHPWAGVSDFKLKFGGKRVSYTPALEVVYQPFWYWIIKIVKKLNTYLTQIMKLARLA